jgi:hypothetical protein
MKKIWLFAIFAVMMSAVMLPSAIAQDVQVGIYILNLGKFDVATGTFTADIYLSMKCNESCSPDKFEFMNGRATSIDKSIDTPTEKFYRIQANLNSPVDLKKFPFDSQHMQIIIEDKENTIDDLRYVPLKAESGIDDSITFVGWNLDGWSVKSVKHEYPIYDETYSQYIFNIDISKIFINSFIKTLLPVIFILLIVLFSFLMDPDKINTRIAMVSSGLVAAVMFHVSITNQIPPVGYLTFADKFMMLTYFILLVSFIMNVIMLEFLEQKKEKLVQKIHHATEYTMFIAVPLLYVLFFILFV